MIYFDENKKAYGYKIENSIAQIDDETWQKYAHTDKWDIIDGEFKDISDTDEYKTKLQENATQTLINELIEQIKELDIKRIRAICEPAQKNETQSWLEYYTAEIQKLREKIASL